MDKIRLSGLTCLANIGVLQEERETPQEILVDLVLHADLEVAAQTDDFEKAIDYQELVEQVQRTVQEGHFQLVETLATRLCEQILDDRRIVTVEVAVRKFPESLRSHMTYVSVEMVRTREDAPQFPGNP